MTNGQETFKIELNEQNQENKINNNENDNFIIKNIISLYYNLIKKT